MKKLGSGLRVSLVVLTLSILAVGMAFATTDDGTSSPKIEQPGPQGPPSDFVENFDSYAAGSDMHGQGGWKGWDNNPGAGALVTNAFALSSPNSVDINGPSDLVHEFSGFTTGQWTVTGWSYVPGNFSGQSYFILLNTYADGGPNNWSTQIRLDSGLGQIVSENEGAALPLVYDTWVPLSVDVDLSANTQDIYYNNQLLSSKSWTEGVSGGGVLNIGAIDLFANFATSVYWDDVTICPIGVACGVPVPTVPAPGLAALALLLMVGGAAMLVRRRV